MPPLPFRSSALPAAAVVAVMSMTPAVASEAFLAAPGPILPGTTAGEAALAQAKASSAAADAALDAVKRIATPGHLLDPVPSALMAGLGDLQAQYADLERKAAGYRATLGDAHPTLKGAEQVLAEMRGQILERARRATVAAERDAAHARSDVAALERRLRATAAATGSIAPVAAAPMPRTVAAPSTTPRVAIAPSSPGAEVVAAARPGIVSAAAPDGPSGGSWLARIFARPLAAAVALIIGFAVLAALAAAVRPRRRRPETARIEPTATIETVVGASTPRRSHDEPDLAVPILAALPIPPMAGSAAILDLFERQPSGRLARTAAAVQATLAAAAAVDAPAASIVLVAPAGSSAGDTDAAALAVAAAAAVAGRRVLIAEGRPDGRLHRALAPDAAPAATVDLGAERRGIVRAAVAGRTLAVLTAVPETVDGPAPAHLPDLAGFDMVIITGEPERGGSVLGADLVLLVAPPGAQASDLAAAALRHGGGRPCGALQVEPVAVRPEIGPRRRPIAAEPAGRLGLRRSFDPARRRA